MKGPNLTWLDWRGVQVCPVVQQHGLRRGKLLETAFCTVRRLSDADVGLEARWDFFCTPHTYNSGLSHNASIRCIFLWSFAKMKAQKQFIPYSSFATGPPRSNISSQHCKFDWDSFKPPGQNQTRPKCRKTVGEVLCWDFKQTPKPCQLYNGHQIWDVKWFYSCLPLPSWFVFSCSSRHSVPFISLAVHFMEEQNKIVSTRSTLWWDINRAKSRWSSHRWHPVRDKNW